MRLLLQFALAFVLLPPPAGAKADAVAASTAEQAARCFAATACAATVNARAAACASSITHG